MDKKTGVYICTGCGIGDAMDVEKLKELAEEGTEAVRSGRFGGKIDIISAIEGAEVNKDDNKLACVIGDEIMVTYVDTLHIDGKKDRSITNRLTVAGRVSRSATADQGKLMNCSWPRAVPSSRTWSVPSSTSAEQLSVS